MFSFKINGGGWNNQEMTYDPEADKITYTPAGRQGSPQLQDNLHGVLAHGASKNATLDLVIGPQSGFTASVNVRGYPEDLERILPAIAKCGLVAA